VVAVAVIAALVAVLVSQGDDEDAVTEPTTTEEPGTTEPATGSTAAPTTASTAPTAAVDTATAVFPDAATSVRFDDPVAAARAFAVDFVGFTDPVVGELMQGDARSGEVEVRPRTDGPVTTAFLRQLGADDTWWVLGSATDGITLDTPAAGDTVTSPVTLTGRALAFEGSVEVEVREDGAPEPIGTGVVTGGGDVERPFEGQVEFSAPTADRGALVLLTRSADDGRVWQAAVSRVQFG
jgi:Immunoglobulin-like domain of bacterial spore germination